VSGMDQEGSGAVSGGERRCFRAILRATEPGMDQEGSGAVSRGERRCFRANLRAAESGMDQEGSGAVSGGERRCFSAILRQLSLVWIRKEVVALIVYRTDQHREEIACRNERQRQSQRSEYMS
jgi:hypothetical protein